MASSSQRSGLIAIVVVFGLLAGYQALPALRPKPIEPFLFGTAGKQHDDERIAKIAVFREALARIDRGEIKSADDYYKFTQAGFKAGRDEAAKAIRSELQEIETKSNGEWDKSAYRKNTERYIKELGG